MDVTVTISVITAASVAVLIGLYHHYSNVYSYWSKKNIKGPKPYYIIGHFMHLYNNNKTGFIKKCAHQYGRLFGLYEGTEPVLAVASVEVARQICIRDFDIFPNHKPNILLNNIQKKFIFSLQDNQWRRVRALMSPTFTSGKMRKMVTLLNRCADDLISSIDEQIDDSTSGKLLSVNIKDTYSLFTMDAITTCCYALKLERVKSATSLTKMASRNEFVTDALKLFELNLKRLMVAFMVNQKLLSWFKFELLSMKSFQPLMKKVEKIIEGRRKSERKIDDYLQLLLDARLDDKVELDEFDLKENHHAALTNESIKSDQERLIAGVRSDNSSSKRQDIGFMSDDEILSNALFLMVVGLETTANLLTSCTYALAFHKRIQEKLRDEIRKIATFDENREPTFNYDAVTSCHYLDAVICETLRVMSPAILTDRVCNQDYFIEECNLTLPKGSKVWILLGEIMNDSEYWTEPERFDPERFMPENKDNIVPGSYCPFGMGPRHCVGMRFSLTESKLALAKIMLKYQFEPAPNTFFPPEIKPNLGLRAMKHPLVNIKRL